MKLIYVASPYDGSMEKNVAFAKAGCDFVMKQGHGFFAPHLTYTKILDESDPRQRQKGLEMALTMLTRCDELWVFGENITQAMSIEMDYAKQQGIPVRQISAEEYQKPVQTVEMMAELIPQMAVC
ncbi:MAG: DUF4406 domain-containing protein [Eubacteriales bacterium]